MQKEEQMKKTARIKVVIMFLGLAMLFCLAGCGKSIHGSFVSEIDSSRKITLKKSNNVGIFDGTVTFKDGDNSTFGYYGIEDTAFGKTIGCFTAGDNTFEFAVFQVLSTEELWLMTDGKTAIDGNATTDVKTTIGKEKFVKTNFFKNLWREHKIACIIGIIAIAIIGYIQDKLEERNIKKNKTEKDNLK